MLFSRIITGILFTTILFAQADKGKEQSQPIPKKFKDGFILEPVKNQPQFQNQFHFDEIVHIPGFSHRNTYVRNNRGFADTLAYHPPGGWNGECIMRPGDAMWTVFQMPTDRILKEHQCSSV